MKATNIVPRVSTSRESWGRKVEGKGRNWTRHKSRGSSVQQPSMTETIVVGEGVSFLNEIFQNR